MDTRIWLRRQFTGELLSATVTVMADNVGEAWWNGTYLGSFNKIGGPLGLGYDLHEFTVPSGALTGWTAHTLAVRVTDDAFFAVDSHYADAMVVAVPVRRGRRGLGLIRG